MYFNKFPKIDYTFQNGQTVPVVDIFRKVSISQESLNNSNIFIDVINGNGSKPETISNNYYGNPELSWTLFLANQTVNPSLDWNLNYETFYSQLTQKYNGSVYYTIKLLDINVNDIAISIQGSIDFDGLGNADGGFFNISSIDVEKYVLINNINKEFRYFSGIAFNNSPISGKIAFLRKNSQGKYSFVENADGKYLVADINKREPYLKSPYYFKYNDLIISPYRIFNPNNRELMDYTANSTTNNIQEPEIITDTSTLFYTILFNYFFGNPLPLGLQKISIEQYELQKYEESIKIKVIKPEFIYPLVELYNTALNSNTIGRSKQIELNI